MMTLHSIYLVNEWNTSIFQCIQIQLHFEFINEKPIEIFVFFLFEKECQRDYFRFIKQFSNYWRKKTTKIREIQKTFFVFSFNRLSINIYSPNWYSCNICFLYLFSESSFSPFILIPTSKVRFNLLERIYVL